ncbi:MAG: aminoacyl-tRNA hydrolase [Spirochaetaceae bacterium]|jgi:PTH1 family peptidyl-tRNA hydrolase|nr:aminoacyl-tRNA hydrolase [Spirochaetaceae bacterium]
MIDLIAFLGNPEREYGGTRHNAGRLLARELPFYGDLHWEKKFHGLYAVMDGASLARFGGAETGGMAQGGGRAGRLHFIIPETYMNNAGESVRDTASFFRIPPERVIAVHDELELPPGVVGLKFGGGLGGHNGLRSLRACLGTPDFWRLRIGIGRPGDREPGRGGPEGVHGDISGWVLSPFTAGEKSVLTEVLRAAAEALAAALSSGAESLLPEWNKKRIVPA